MTLLDALIIGGGFYGVSIARYLVESRGARSVRLVEREPMLLARASYANQARIHNGYHYPRSYVTAYRSRINFPRFSDDYSFAAYKSFTKLYAIARRNSKVSARQFVRFCRDIGAKVEPAPKEYVDLFDRHLIESAFLVEECAFDASKLREWAWHQMVRCGVDVSLNTVATEVTPAAGGGLSVNLAPAGSGGEEVVRARAVFNCSYSGLNQFGENFSGSATKLKHEITEMGLLAMPPVLADLGVTVMDGPFFSAMPFPARGLHSLSHVRYTPHTFWYDEAGINPYARLDHYIREPRVDRMIRDVSRYIPAILDAKYKDSLFEVKTVLVKNEGDDGRPILFEHHKAMKNFYFILGGKIDNIYDIFEKLDQESFE